MADVAIPTYLLAVEEIKRLKARYFRFIDTKNWKGLGALFTSDATLCYPEFSSEATGVAAAMGFISSALDGGTSIHHGHMPEIELQSSTSARGIWAMEDRIFWPSDRVSSLGFETLHGYGHYHEEYQNIDGIWLIKSLRLTRLWSRTILPARRAD